MFNLKKKYFKRKLKGVKCMTWDLEFKREKTLMIREDIRREYDGTQAKLQLIKDRLKAQLKDPSKVCEVHNPGEGKEKIHRSKGKCVCEYIENHIEVGEIERLYDDIELLEIDRARFVDQMKGLDIEVHGSKRTNEYPEGVDGLDQQLGALQELQSMVRQYIKKL